MDVINNRPTGWYRFTSPPDGPLIGMCFELDVNDGEWHKHIMAMPQPAPPYAPPTCTTTYALSKRLAESQAESSPPARELDAAADYTKL